MAFWSPDKASCDYPEEEELWSPASASGGGAGGASGDKSLISPSNRGRRVTASRARAASSAGGDDGQSGRMAEGFSASDVGDSVAEGDEGAPGDGPVNSREEVEWVQCDGCRKWRKLSGGMRSEDLPEQWWVVI